MEKALCCLLVTLFASYLLMIPSNAIPSTRMQRLHLQEAVEMPSVKGRSTPKMEMEGFMSNDAMIKINARMDLGFEDYDPPGPNNHHTPRPPGRS